MLVKVYTVAVYRMSFRDPKYSMIRMIIVINVVFNIANMIYYLIITILLYIWAIFTDHKNVHIYTSIANFVFLISPGHSEGMSYKA